VYEYTDAQTDPARLRFPLLSTFETGPSTPKMQTLKQVAPDVDHAVALLLCVNRRGVPMPIGELNY
jgi:hypothetical protein